jgi:quinone-modifying oxidoreductase subunit QmoA
MAYPERYVIDPRMIGTADAEKAKAACKYGAVDLDMKEEMLTLKVGAVIFATGWTPYDAAKIQPYGYDRYPNVISSVEFERMKDPSGPTGGKVLRPSDGKEAKDVAFIQCAGSRDRNYLKHCSRICCMASLKQTTYVSEIDGGNSTIYYIDIRAIDRFEDFYQKVQADPKVKFIKSKPANITQDKDGNPIVNGVNTEGYHRYATAHDLVVLAVGMEPSIKGAMPEGVKITVNEHGFIENDGSNGGIFAAGCASDALDVNRAVQSATASALKAIQVINRVAGMEG